MKINIMSIVLFCCLTTCSFAQSGNGGISQPNVPPNSKPSNGGPAQTGPGLNRPNNLPGSPNNPVDPNTPGNPANPNRSFNPQYTNHPGYRNYTNNEPGYGRGMTNDFRSDRGMTNGFRDPRYFNDRGLTNQPGYGDTNGSSYDSNNPHSSLKSPYAVDPRTMGGSGSVTNR